MRTSSVRRAGVVLLTVAAGVSLLLGASRAPAGAGYRAPVQPAPVQATPVQATWAAPGVSGAYQFLSQMNAATGVRSYLSGAETVAGWIQANSADPRGPGGYTGGYANSGTKLQWKSTEQNIDVYAFFSLLGRESGLAAWADRAGRARTFVVSMWNPAAGRFSLGTTTDGVTVNDSPQTEDVNSWTYLALQSPAYAASVGWDVRNLASATGRLRGVSICPGDRAGVWFEGTAHPAEALTTRARPGDSAQAAANLSDIAYAQAHGPDEDGLGIMAASKDGLTDCEGDSVNASLRTGTTAWYILAERHVNPLSATTPISAQ